MTEEDPKSLRFYHEEVRPRLESGMSTSEVSRELGLAIEDVERFAVPYSHRDGPELFRDIISTLQKHYYFERTWHYVVAALFVLQSRCVKVLPAVFYLFLGGAKGSGKTNVLDLLCILCKGIKCENASVPALARSMENGKTVLLDEIDVDRGREANEIRDALLRQGYKASAAPYLRWDMNRRAPEPTPVFGPKAATYRSSLKDDALRDRGFQIPAVKAVGEDSYDYVLRNFWPDVGDLPSRLDAWEDAVISTYTADKLREVAFSEEFKERVKKTVVTIGANRESEVTSIVQLVAEIAGIDVSEEFKEAVRTREVADEDIADDLEELGDVVCYIANQKREMMLSKAPVVRLKQSEIKAELDKRRNLRNERNMSARQLALLRRELGVRDSWRSKPQNAVVWDVPESFLLDLANKANLVNQQSIPDWKDTEDSQVRQVRQLREDFKNGMSRRDLERKYGKDLVDREKVPVVGGQDDS